MAAPEEVLDSGTGPGMGWLVAGAVAVLLGLGTQLPWSGHDQGAAATRTVSAAASVTPSAPPHWRGRIILPDGEHRGPVLVHQQTYPDLCPRTADAAMRWLREYGRGKGCR